MIFENLLTLTRLLSALGIPDAAEAYGGAPFRLASPATVGAGEEELGLVEPGAAAQDAV